MIRVVNDKTYKFMTIFNDETGESIRGIGREDDPFMAEFPHLIDCGLMGHCEHGKSGLCVKAGIKCYQDGLHACNPNMTLENYKKIVNQCEGRLFEIALGGAGDPDMHENFEEVLKYTREHGIVPNFTTSGLGMTPEKASLCKKYCGAVAVSMYSRLQHNQPILVAREGENKYADVKDIPKGFTLGGYNENCKKIEPSVYEINGKMYEEIDPIDFEPMDGFDYYSVFDEKEVTTFTSEGMEVVPNYTMRAIKMLLDAGVKTNIHFVVSNTTIGEALARVKYNGFPKGINAVVFLLHKPVGLGTSDDVLDVNDPRVKEFFELVDKGGFPYKIGFDSCSIPGVVKWSKHIDPCSVDTCEGSRFSMYITADMKALPCSFDNQDQKYAVQLGDDVSIEDSWNSAMFNKFRDSLRFSCPNCPHRELCMGGCPLQNSIVLCNDKAREFYLAKKEN